jgi:hypothetical protein
MMERFICSVLLVTSLYTSIAADPVAISDLIIVNAGEAVVVRLKGFDLAVRNVIYVYMYMYIYIYIYLHIEVIIIHM